MGYLTSEGKWHCENCLVTIPLKGNIVKMGNWIKKVSHFYCYGIDVQKREFLDRLGGDREVNAS